MGTVFHWINRNFSLCLFSSVVIGVALAFLLGEQVMVLKPLGTLFTRLLIMVVPVLVFFSIATSFANIGDAQRMKRWGGKIIGWFLISMLIATFIGIGTGLYFKPGLGIDLPAAEYKATEITAQMFIEWIPKNFVGCLAEGNTIQIVFLSIFVGIATVLMPESKSKTFLMDALNTGQDLVLQIVKGIMFYAPIGVAALIATSIGDLEGSFIAQMGSFLSAYTVAFILQVVIMYFILLYAVGKINPFRFTRKLFPALITAFTTTSSAATLPMNLRCVKEMGVDKEMAEFGLPLGVTFNMDSMGFEIPLYIMLGMYAVGAPPTVGELFLFVIMGVAFSIGCAGVPGGGIAIAVILVNAFGLPTDVVAWIAAVFFYLDITGTAMNIWGDAVCTAIVASREGMIDWDKMNA